MPLPYVEAAAIADQITQYFAAQNPAPRVALTGELRRKRSLVHSLRILLSPPKWNLILTGPPPDQLLFHMLANAPHIASLSGGPKVFEAPLPDNSCRIYFHICPPEPPEAWEVLLLDTTGPGNFKQIFATRARGRGWRFFAGQKTGIQASKEALVILSPDNAPFLYGLFEGQNATATDGRPAWSATRCIAADEPGILKALRIPWLDPPQRDDYAARFTPIPMDTQPEPELMPDETPNPEPTPAPATPAPRVSLSERILGDDSESVTRQYYAQILPQMLVRANMQPAIHNQTFDTWVPPSPSADIALRTAKTIGVTPKRSNNSHLRGIYIHSFPASSGTGKTHLLAAIGHNIIRRYPAAASDFDTPPLVWFQPYSEFALLCRSAFLEKKQSARFTNLIDTLTSARVLLFDDFAGDGTRESSDWIYNTLIYILDSRLRNQRITCFSSNISLSDIGTLYDIRIESRVRAMVYRQDYGQYEAHLDFRATEAVPEIS